MIISRNRKIIIISLVVIVICIASMIMFSTIEPTTSEPTKRNLEFVSGENVFMTADNKLQFQFKTYKQIGEIQNFSMTFKNTSDYIATATMNVKYPTDYFVVECNPIFELQPGETKTYYVSIKLVKNPPKDAELNFSLNMKTEYLK